MFKKKDKKDKKDKNESKKELQKELKKKDKKNDKEGKNPLDNYPDDSDDPADETNPEFAYLWDDPASFKEETFAKNFTSHRKWTDIQYTIIFWLNLIASIVCFVLTDPTSNEKYTGELEGLTLKDILIVGAVCIAVSFVICALTLLFITFLPRIYVKFAIGVILVILFAVLIPVALIGSYWTLIFGGIVIIAALFFAFKVCSKLNFSADVLHASAMVIRKFPSVFVFNLISFIVQSGISYMFSVGSVQAWAIGISPWVYVYVIISYFFVSQTITYFSHCVFAGVAAAWYFLNESVYMPKSPLLHALKNTIGPNFGPCALAGLLEGISNAFSFIEKSGPTMCVGCCCFNCIKCCCKCILCIAKCITGFISQYSLIYCAMFGVPAKEGVKRWKKVAKKKLVKQVVNSTVIGMTFDFYSYCASAVGMSAAGLLGVYLYGKGTPEFTFMCTMGALFAFNGLLLVSRPAEVMADTIFIGLAEAPLRLETGARSIYESFDDESKELMQKEIDIAKGVDKGGCCCC